MRVRTVLVIVLLALAAPADAQNATPRVEAGPDMSLFRIQYWPSDAGGGAHVTVALTPLIAIETRVRAFGNEPLPSIERGGRTVQVFSAARATFVSRGRVII